VEETLHAEIQLTLGSAIHRGKCPGMQKSRVNVREGETSGGEVSGGNVLHPDRQRTSQTYCTGYSHLHFDAP